MYCFLKVIKHTLFTLTIKNIYFENSLIYIFLITENICKQIIVEGMTKDTGNNKIATLYTTLVKT